MNKEKASEVKVLFEEIIEIEAILTTMKEGGNHNEYLAKRLTEISGQPYHRPHICPAVRDIVNERFGQIVVDLKKLKDELEEVLKDDY